MSSMSVFLVLSGPAWFAAVGLILACITFMMVPTSARCAAARAISGAPCRRRLALGGSSGARPRP